MAGTRYGLLLVCLRGLPAEQTAVTFTFAELEAIVGPLSRSARTRGGFWDVVVHGMRWRRYGWTAHLNRSAGSVTFTRR